MRNVLTLLIIGFVSIVNAQNPVFQEYVGKHYRNFSEFEAFKEFTDYGGMLLNHRFDQDTTDAFALYGKGDTLIVIFESAYNPNGGPTARYIFIDGLIIEKPSKKYSVIYGQCLFEGAENSYIVAVVKTKRQSEYFTKCRKAWQIHPVKRVFEEIDPKKVKCINEGYGCC